MFIVERVTYDFNPDGEDNGKKILMGRFVEKKFAEECAKSLVSTFYSDLVKLGINEKDILMTVEGTDIFTKDHECHIYITEC